MLTKLDIRDFQAHKELAIDLDPLVTTIVGSSDVGKSAIIRALRWVMLNKPSGDAFLRDGAETVRVSLTVGGNEEENWITRRRGKGGNAYALNGTALEAFASAVPDVVMKVVNVADVNFQGQHDNPFWFGETAGEVSRQLNEIVNLGVIDRVLSSLNSQVRDVNVKVRLLEQQVETAKVERDRLKPVRVVDEALQGLEGQNNAISAIRLSATTLASLVSEVLAHSERGKTAAQVGLSAKQAMAAGQAWADLASRRGSLSLLVDEAAQLEGQASVVVPDIAPLVALHASWENAVENLDEFELVVDEVVARRTATQTSKVNAETLHRQLENEMVGKECPLCGQKIKSL